MIYVFKFKIIVFFGSDKFIKFKFLRKFLSYFYFFFILIVNIFEFNKKYCCLYFVKFVVKFYYFIEIFFFRIMLFEYFCF